MLVLKDDGLRHASDTEVRDRETGGSHRHSRLGGRSLVADGCGQYMCTVVGLREVEVWAIV